MHSVPSSELTCRKCQVGHLVKLPVGYTCDRCGDAPFGGPREKVDPPSPIVVKPVMPERVMTIDFEAAAAAEIGPHPVLYSSKAPPTGTSHVLWTEAGAGVRFALEVPLQVLPPGKPVNARVLVENKGPYVVMASMLIVPSARSPGQHPLRLTSGDLPVGSILEVTCAVPLPKDASQSRVAVLCQPLPPSGVAQNPWKAPEAVPDMGTPPLGLPSSHVSVSFRTKARCPRCEGSMRWHPAQGAKVRGWVCEDCSHRVETGSLN